MAAPLSMLDRVDDATRFDDDSIANRIVSATYIGADDQRLRFDLGDQRIALVEVDEFSSPPQFEVDDDVPILVEDQRQDTWRASVVKAQKLAIWRWLESIHQSGQHVEGTIVAKNKGGLSADIGVRAFLPMSHVDLHRIDDVEPYIGMDATFQVIEFDKKRANIVVSRRKVLEARQKEQRQEFIKTLETGQVHRGVVKNMTDYGAFVDIGGIDGLLHVSNLSWNHVSDPRDVLEPNQAIEVVILKWDPDKERLGLGRKQLLDDPWKALDEDVDVGDTISGKVTNLVDFGAFVEVRPGIEGLIHVSELSWSERTKHPGKVLEKGQEVEAKVISLDVDQQRLGLSLKQLQNNPWEAVASKFPEDSIVEGPITNITDFGLFVEVDDGVEGLVHISDISWTETVHDAEERFEVGETVKAVVLDIDVHAHRMSLGIKQLDDDPWEAIPEIAVPGEKIEVTITKLTDFGAFADVHQGIEGLIHISELSEGRVNSPSDVVRPGQTVQALVMTCDPDQRRIGLSLYRDELPVDDADLSEYADSDEDSGTTLGDLLGDQLRQGDD